MQKFDTDIELCGKKVQNTFTFGLPYSQQMLKMLSLMCDTRVCPPRHFIIL
jgi:hypothetical protein